jgi:hypothetical protein
MNRHRVEQAKAMLHARLEPLAATFAAKPILYETMGSLFDDVMAVVVGLTRAELIAAAGECLDELSRRRTVHARFKVDREES